MDSITASHDDFLPSNTSVLSSNNSILSDINATITNTTREHSMCMNLMYPRDNREVFLADTLLGLPTLLFIGFLLLQARSSVRKLYCARNTIMTTYYFFLWLVCLVNLMRASIEMAYSHAQDHYTLWSILWLITRFGMVFLEVSVVVFLCQGYLTNGRTALVRTLAISSAVAIADTAFKGAVIWGWGYHLYGNTSKEFFENDDYRVHKWVVLSSHTLLYLVLYVTILVLPHTKWRDRLPAQPLFYRYVSFLALINTGGVVSGIMLALGMLEGFCVYATVTWVYYALFPPALYVTFLADFFQGEELEFESPYYSEMKDAGYFDDEDFILHDDAF